MAKLGFVAVVAVAAAVAAACGGGSSAPDAPAPDARAPDAPASDAPVSDAPPADAALPDAVVADADPDAPMPTGAMTTDGYTQVRQGDAAVVILTGTQLDGATSVTFGTIGATIVSTSPTTVRVSLTVPHASAPGAVDAVITSPTGTGTLADAIDITPYVAAADAVAGGHGTYQSPLRLCDPDIGTARRGDTIDLLAGTHVCAGEVQPWAGVTIHGAGTGATIIDGSGAAALVVSPIGPEVPGDTTVIRDLTLGDRATVDVIAGSVVIDDVVSIGAVDARPPAQDVTVTGFDGVAMDLSVTGTASVSASRFHDAGCLTVRADPMSFEWGAYTITGVEFERCTSGLTVGVRPAEFGAEIPFPVAVTACQFADNATAIRIRDGSTTITSATITGDDSAPPVSQRGIDVQNGEVVVDGGQITGQTIAGIRVFGLTTIDYEDHAWVRIHGVTIDGGPTGIAFAPFDDNSLLELRDSIVRNQTTASVAVSDDEANADLGSPTDPGGNQLSVTTGFALDDHRADVFFTSFISAHGTTLNGVSFDGTTVSGPTASPPYYRITGDGDIAF